MENKRNINILFRLLIIICSILMMYSGYKLLNIYLDYRAIDEETYQLQEEYVEVNKEDSGSTKRVIYFDELKSRNEDVVGWLYIPGTNIDEPLLLGDSNNEYVRSTIDHKYSIGGCLFVDSSNSGSFEETNTIIYGHNMKNGSKFHDIRYYVNEESYIDEHKLAYVYFPNGNVKKYELFASGTVNALNKIYNLYSDKSEYYNLVMDIAKIKRDVNKKELNNMVMLSTCHSSETGNRFVVWGMETSY